MDKEKISLILASASPRRKELIQGTFLKHKIETADIDENINGLEPEELAKYLAREKANVILKRHMGENVLVLGADTIVVVDNEVLGKPKNVDHAREMLQTLSGRSHTVITGIALLTHEKEIVKAEYTEVTFNKIDRDLLELYLKTGESLDKAGSYGIQGVALSFIKDVKGSYSNVVGLPVDIVLSSIKEIVGSHEDSEGKWREMFI